jgi:putative membrane protein
MGTATRAGILLEMKASPCHQPTRRLLAVLALLGAFLAAGPTGTAADISLSQQAFLDDADHDGQREIVLAELATTHASNPDVRAFAQELKRDHQVIGSELQKITMVKRSGFGGDTADTTADRALDPHAPGGAPKLIEQAVDELGAKTGADFDRAFLQAMIRDHQKAVDRFEAAAGDKGDADVRDFASHQLPILRQHLARARELAGAVAPK